jgi:hypothetical protein
MKNLKLLSVLSAVILLATVSCSKSGSTGPAGPKGPAGPDSVLHSAWISLVTPLSSNDSLYEQVITASGLTSAILDNGVVLSYIGFPGSGTSGTDTAVFSLSEASNLVAPISQALYVGEIDLFALSDYTGALYRYVLIPGTIVTNGIDGKKYTKQQLQTMTYANAQKIFGISSGASAK